MRVVWFLLLGVFAMLGNQVIAAPAIEDYGKLPSIRNVAISPNGNLIAFRRTLADDQDYIIAYNLKKNKQIASFSISDVEHVDHWFIDDNFIFLQAETTVSWTDYRGEIEVGTAFSLDISANTIEPLIRLGDEVGTAGQVHPGQTGIGIVSGTSADGEYLFMPAYTNGVKRKVSGPSASSGQFKYSLLKVHKSGKKAPRLADHGESVVTQYFLGENGEQLARISKYEKSNNYYIDARRGGKWETVYKYTAEINDTAVMGLSRDYSALYINDWEGDEEYFQIDLKSGAKSLLDIEPKANSSKRYLRDRKGRFLGFRFSGFSPKYQFIDKELEQRISTIVEQFPDHSVFIESWTPDLNQVIVRVEGVAHVGDYFLMKKGAPPRFIASARAEIDAQFINPIAKLAFKARDGLAIPTLVTLPLAKIDNPKGLPAVIFPHGGPASYDQVQFDFFAQALASKGYLVIQPQFRGSRGFGRAHLEAGWGEWGRKMQDDLTDAVMFFVSKGYADPKKICIAGASYGGYAALVGATDTPDLYKCVVSIAGVSDLVLMLNNDKSKYGRNSEVLDYFERSILDGDYDKAALRQISPFYNATNVSAPVLLIHGESDRVVDYEQSKKMYKALKKHGSPVNLVKLKREDHYLSESENRQQALKEVVGFIEQHLGT